jgi:hypothetical protein
MKVTIENYKGIEFIRISGLPREQKEAIWKSLNSNKVIKILRNNELLNDCLQINDYQEWYNKFFSHPVPVAKDLKLAYK